MTTYSYDGYLCHFGIKNQKWGVRRFQNPDGTLTAAGKVRYKQYKQDVREYNKLNRHVAATQKHQKEEGIMLDRVRDKYQKANKNYKKEMAKSSGFLGLNAAKKADRVAKAQLAMDKIGKDYSDAANAYGQAKSMTKDDVNKLRRHVDGMISKYGKGSINEVETETLKIGQNKLQKLMQGAPISTILGKRRDTDTFVKTGKTLADMPVIGNLYTASYVGNKEFEFKRNEIEKASNNDKAKRATNKDNGPKYLNDNYFDGASSVGTQKKQNDKKSEEKSDEKQNKETKKEKAEEKKAKEKQEKEERIAKAKKDELNKRINDLDNQHAKDIKTTKDAERDLKEAQIKVRVAEKKAEKLKKQNKLTEYADARREVDKLSAKADKKQKIVDKLEAKEDEYIRDRDRYKEELNKVQHSGLILASSSGELYHHGVIGQKWGVRRFQNSDGSLTAAGRKRYYSTMSVKKAYNITNRQKAKLAVKSAGRYAAAYASSAGIVVAGAMTGNPAVAYAIPVAALTSATYAAVKESEDQSEYSKKYINGGFSDTKNVDDLSKIAPIRRNELSIPKGTEFTRVSTKEQEDGKKRLYACLSSDNREIDYYSKIWPKYLKRIKNDPNIKVYKNRYEVTADIVAPSIEKRKEVIQAILNADKKMKIELGKAYAMDQMRLSTGAFNAKTVNDIKKLYASKEERKSIDEFYSKVIESTTAKDFDVINNSRNYKAFQASIPTSPKLMNAYIKELKAQGFNAVYDDNSNSKSAFIFFDESMIKQISSEEIKHMLELIRSESMTS